MHISKLDDLKILILEKTPHYSNQSNHKVPFKKSNIYLNILGTIVFPNIEEDTFTQSCGVISTC